MSVEHMLPLGTLYIPHCCGRRFDFRRLDFDALEFAFKDAPKLTLGQAWNEALSDGFAPGIVRVMASENQLRIWADLTDDLPRNAATAPNQRTWELGDCFEIFLADSAAGPYYEMHVTPENQTLQLRFESRDSDFGASLISNGLLRSETFVTSNGWQILASVPLELVGESGWISFSRYDYGCGQREPILSSSSLHREPNFHRRHEWTRFELQRDL